MDQADEAFEQAKAHFLNGLQRMELGLWGQAEQAFKASLGWMPDRPSTLTNLAACLIQLERLDEAEVLLNQTLAIDAKQGQAWLNRGLIAAGKKDFALAISHYEQAMNLNPHDAQAWSNKGLALSEMGQMDAALACMSRALELDPDRADYWSNRAVVWSEQGDMGQALADHERALKVAPDDAETQYNKALLLLRLKRFKEGFDLYESRWRVDRFGGRPLISDVPKWKGQSVAKLLLWSEQGLGDEIFYASFLNALSLPDTLITVAVDPRLVIAFKRSFPQFEVIDRHEAQRLLQIGYFQGQAPMASLGALLGMDENKIRGRRSPYLKSDPLRRAKFRRQLTLTAGMPICGVSWASKNQRIGDAKSVALARWADVLRTPAIHFVNLQYGDVADEILDARQELGCQLQVIEGLNLYDDIEGALALVDACDMIITTSNVTAHLAGALGKPACVLIPNGKGKIWYWHDDGTSMWYPSLKLLHQKNLTDWESPMLSAKRWLLG